MRRRGWCPRWGLVVTVVFLSGVLTVPARPAAMAPGELDSSFGEGGRVLTEFGSFADGARAVALQPNGQIVLAGRSDVNGNPEFALARYNGDGSPDAAFGRGGKVLTDFGDAAWAAALTVQPNGEIVAAGGAYASGTAQFALARYNADGSLDTSFGAGGKVLTGIRSTAGANAVAVQPDGRIVAAGWSHGNVADATEFALARYDGNGSLDTSFGRGGTVLTGLGENAAAHAVAVQPDGWIVVVGGASANGTTDFALVRYNPNGSPDASFGKGGKVLTDFGDPAWASAAAVVPNGQIVVAGYSYANGKARLALARYNGDGAPESSFGKGGKVLTDWGDTAGTLANALAVQPDGRIVVAGEAIANRTAEFALARYNGDGALDASFGSGGKVLAHFGDAAGAAAVAVQPDGQVIAAGWSDANGRGSFALARFQGR